MNTAYASLLTAVAPAFVVIACGFGLRRLGKLQPVADASLLTVAVNFLYPCFIADAVLANHELRDFGNVLIAPVAGAALLAGSFGIAALVARAMRLQRPHPARTFTFTAAIPNWGYLPVPLVQAIFPGSIGVLFVHNIGFELVLWSLGVWLLAGEGSWRRVFNIPFFAILAALALNLARASDWLPAFVMNSLHFLGQGAVPLSLLLTGAMLADSVAAGSLTQNPARTLTGCIVKLGILPPLIILAARYLPCSLDLKRVLVVQAAMPCAMVPVVLTRLYHADTGTAVRLVITTTLLGLLTIPLWLRIGAHIVGL